MFCKILVRLTTIFGKQHLVRQCSMFFDWVKKHHQTFPYWVKCCICLTTWPGWKVRFCYAKGLRHANCLKTIGLLFYHCSSCRSTPKIFGVTYMFSSVATWLNISLNNSIHFTSYACKLSFYSTPKFGKFSSPVLAKWQTLVLQIFWEKCIRQEH